VVVAPLAEDRHQLNLELGGIDAFLLNTNLEVARGKREELG
jgi:hypothetical protein